MKLFQLEDFDQIIVQTAEWLREKGKTRISEQLVEKDYYVTEVLRIISRRFGDKAIFKGGTSLSKGWGIIDRFSEDVDLFVNPARFDPPLGSKRIRRTLNELRDLIAEHPGLSWDEQESRELAGSCRSDRFTYQPTQERKLGVVPSVLLEAGTRSGDHPVAVVELGSYVAEFLEGVGQSSIAEDVIPFPMTLLHFRRTFVEKLFAVHHNVEMMIRDGLTLGVHARHYYDLAHLSHTQDVRNMLLTPEFVTIKEDCKRNADEHFKFAIMPENLCFGESCALFPHAELKGALAEEYCRQCDLLCFAEQYPSFDEVLGVFEDLRMLL